jgi:hypothetical protein
MCLGGLLEEVRVLLELGGHAHVAELVAQRDHQAANQGRIHLLKGSCHEKMDLANIVLSPTDTVSQHEMNMTNTILSPIDTDRF